MEKHSVTLHDWVFFKMLQSPSVKLNPSNVQMTVNLVRKGVHLRPLRAAQNVWKLVDIFNSVFEGLYLGQGLSSFAIVRRQVITELVQSLRETPHPHLLPLTGLHASLCGHLGFARPLCGCSRRASREVDREVVNLPVSARAAHLRWRAHGVYRGLRRGGLKWVVILSQSMPIG